MPWLEWSFQGPFHQQEFHLNPIDNDKLRNKQSNEKNQTAIYF